MTVGRRELLRMCWLKLALSPRASLAGKVSLLSFLSAFSICWYLQLNTRDLLILFLWINIQVGAKE